MFYFTKILFISASYPYREIETDYQNLYKNTDTV